MKKVNMPVEQKPFLEYSKIVSEIYDISNILVDESVLRGLETPSSSILKRNELVPNKLFGQSFEDGEGMHIVGFSLYDNGKRFTSQYGIPVDPAQKSEKAVRGALSNLVYLVRNPQAGKPVGQESERIIEHLEQTQY